MRGEQKAEVEFGCVICSTPNGRGIHGYAKYVSELYNYKLIAPKQGCISYLLWETVGIMRELRTLGNAKGLIFANTRVTPFLWPYIKWSRVTVVVHDLMDTLEDRSRLRRKSQLGYFKRWLNGILLRRSIEAAERVLCNSHHTKNELVKWLGREYEDCCVLTPPLSFREELEDGRIEKWKETEREGEFRLKILAVAGMSANKAHEEYFRLHSILIKEMKIVIEMTIYGIDEKRVKGEFREYVERKKCSLQIKNRRESSELFSDYLECDVLVSLSTDEGYGMPVSDACAFGIQSIVRDIGAFREQSSNSLGSGGIMLVEDVRECAERVKDVYDVLGESGRVDTRQRKNERALLYEKALKEELRRSGEISWRCRGER